MDWSDETLKLRPAVSGEPLRIGVWLERRYAPAWMGQVIRRIRATRGLHLAAIFLSPQPAEDSHETRAYRLYRNWSRGRVPDDGLVDTDLTPAFDGLAPAVAEDQVIRGQQLDVLVWLGPARAGDCAGLARCGVWSFGLGDPSLYRNLPPYFWEMQRRDPVSSLLLYCHEQRFESGRILYRYDAATRETLHVAGNAVEPLSMAPVVVVRRLLDLRQHGGEWLARLPSCEETVAIQPRSGYPGWARLAAFLVSAGFRRLVSRWRESRGEREWFVAFRRDAARNTTELDSFQPEGFTSLDNPRGSYLADPFLIQRQGRTFLFVEQMAAKTYLGHLAALEVLPEGFSAPVPVLQPPYHISYPCLIQRGAEVFLLPETAEHRTVQLYRATDFPRVWTLHKILVEGAALVDTTPFEHQGRWYFFTSTVDLLSGYWSETFLFYADSLDGEWRYHPQNPVCSDVRRARGAGHLFYRQGKLIRPAQDCSLRYGYAIVFNEVLVLSPERYRERPIEVILPRWQPGLDGTHTFNAAAGLEVIDGTRAPA